MSRRTMETGECVLETRTYQCRPQYPLPSGLVNCTYEDQKHLDDLNHMHLFNIHLCA